MEIKAEHIVSTIAIGSLLAGLIFPLATLPASARDLTSSCPSYPHFIPESCVPSLDQGYRVFRGIC